MPVFSFSAASRLASQTVPSFLAFLYSSSFLSKPSLINCPSFIDAPAFSSIAAKILSESLSFVTIVFAIFVMFLSSKHFATLLTSGNAFSVSPIEIRSRGFVFPYAMRAESLSISRIPRSDSRRYERFSLSFAIASTALSLALMLFAETSGFSIQFFIRRAPMLVTVLSRSHSKLPYRFPSCMVSVSSRFRLVLTSMSINESFLTKFILFMCDKSRFPVCSIYSTSAPPAEIASFLSAHSNGSRVLTPSCFKSVFSALSKENAQSKYVSGRFNLPDITLFNTMPSPFELIIV